VRCMAKVVRVVLALTVSGFALAGPVMAENNRVGVGLPLSGNLAKSGEIENMR
jgi:hypothetical protein